MRSRGGEAILHAMEESAKKPERRRARSDDFFSCAFCHETSPKPFKICESCGEQALAGEEGGDNDDEG